jgi:hypothetical protein
MEADKHGRADGKMSGSKALALAVLSTMGVAATLAVVSAVLFPDAKDDSTERSIPALALPIGYAVFDKLSGKSPSVSPGQKSKLPLLVTLLALVLGVVIWVTHG